MSPHDIAFTLKIGHTHGPAALALLYAVTAAGGTWAGKDADIALVVGCSARHLQIVRSALVSAGVLTYTPGQRNRLPACGVVGDSRPAASRGGKDEPPPVVNPVTPAQEAAPAVAAKARKPQPADPLFDEIVRMVCGGIAPGKRTGASRIAMIANEMAKAGMTADRLRLELPLVVGRYAKWRSVIDLDAVDKCWRWIVSPPATVEKDGGDGLAASAMKNGNPWRTQP